MSVRPRPRSRFVCSISEFCCSAKKSSKGTYFSGVAINEVWQVEKHLRLILPKGSRRAQLENIIHPDSNTFVFQKFKSAPFEADVTFVGNAKRRFSSPNEIANAHQNLVKLLDSRVEEAKIQFDQRFEETFHLKQKGYNADQLLMAKTAFCNLIGGTGYFYGHNRIHIQRPPNEPQWGLSGHPHALFTGTPSRSYFPRGFLWDEGFHQLIIGTWDKEISKDMLYHWLNLMNRDGWIPREQILGGEAESRVPPEFIVQNPEYANPPTLYFPLEAMIARGSLSQHDLRFLRASFHKLAQNYLWYLRSQRGPVRNSFRWRGAHGNHTLPSGLDDYPRAAERSELEEHVDLLSWMIMSSNILDKIAKAIDVYDAPQFKAIEQELIHTLQERYWNSKTNSYCDYDGKKSTFLCHLGR
jgi:mannosyl-oligosaccharide glucosidase